MKQPLKMSGEQLAQVHKELTANAAAIMARKNADYGGSGGDVFANLTLVESLFPSMRTEHGIVIRMGDKLRRIANLLDHPAKVEDEKLADSLLDLINYAVLLAAVLKCRSANPVEATVDPSTCPVCANAMVDVCKPGPDNSGPIKVGQKCLNCGFSNHTGAGTANMQNPPASGLNFPPPPDMPLKPPYADCKFCTGGKVTHWRGLPGRAGRGYICNRCGVIHAHDDGPDAAGGPVPTGTKPPGPPPLGTQA